MVRIYYTAGMYMVSAEFWVNSTFCEFCCNSTCLWFLWGMLLDISFQRFHYWMLCCRCQIHCVRDDCCIVLFALASCFVLRSWLMFNYCKNVCFLTKGIICFISRFNVQDGFLRIFQSLELYLIMLWTFAYVLVIFLGNYLRQGGYVSLLVRTITELLTENFTRGVS